MKCAMQVDDNSTGKKGDANIVELFFNLIIYSVTSVFCHFLKFLS